MVTTDQTNRAARWVTLVLTDVVGSTKIAATLGDERNAALWDAHDKVARELVATFDGREVERTDGILALFDDLSHGVRFALAYLAALRAIEPPLLARVAVHRGPLVVRPNPTEHVERGAKPLEADGLSLSVTARVNALALGNQILVTDAARLDEDARIASRGHWRLKGAPEPVEIFELTHDEAPNEVPADGEKAFRVVKDGDHWLPVREIPRALPKEWDRFVGRDDDLRQLDTLFEQGARLVSVTGAGGTGKTRLVTRFGWARLANYVGGVWFCDLSDARDADGIIRAVAVTLNVPLGEPQPVDQLAQAIGGRGPCLVVLDNFEQVADLAEPTVGTWLENAPNASFLVTTRELLSLRGEVSLSLPPLAEDDAVALFAARATAAQPDFALGPDNEADIRALVRLLDRLPLAIELAAHRIRVVSPRTLLERMSAHFELLAIPEAQKGRQATLRATLDWSWNLLSDGLKACLGELSVFEGGFTLEAAEAVLSSTGLLALDVLQALVDRSLVRKVGDNRFDLLLIVRTYAAERLDAAGTAADVALRHGRYYARFAPASRPNAWSESARELDNIVAACRRAIARNDAAVALPTLKAAWAVTDRQGPAALAASLAAEVGDLPGLAPGLRDRLLSEALLAQGSHVEGQRELRLCLERLGYAEPSTFIGLVARILSRVGAQVLRRMGRTPRPPKRDAEIVMAATRAYQRLVETYWFANEPPRMLGAALSALHLCEPLGPSPELARAYATLSLATSGLRFDATADRYAALALQTAVASKAGLAEAYVRFIACVYRIGHGRWDEVDRDLATAIDLFEQGQDHRLLGDAQTVAAMADLYRGRFEAAKERFELVRRTGRRQGNAQHTVWGGLGQTEAELRLGRIEVAAERMAEVMQILESFASPLETARAWGLRALVELEQGRPDIARVSAEKAESLLRKFGAPTAHYLLEGYAGTAEVLVRLERPAGRAMKMMKTFAKAFPIGEPRLCWLMASQAASQGNTPAHALLDRGVAAAKRLAMTAEHDRLSALTRA